MSSPWASDRVEVEGKGVWLNSANAPGIQRRPR